MEITPISSWNLNVASLLKNLFFGPGFFVFLLVIAAAWVLLFPKKRRGLFIYLVFVIAMLFFYTSPLPVKTLGHLLIVASQKLEDPSCALSRPVFVVLGGGMSLPNEPSTATLSRLNEAAVVLRELAAKKEGRVVVVSGGPTLPDQDATEAHAGVNYLKMVLGEASSIHTFLEEGRSLNTYQNASYTAELLREKKLPLDIVLVTGGFHMLRSVETFRHAGITVCAHSSPEVRGGRTLSFENAIRTFMVLNEWIGIAAYGLRGWL